MKKINNLNFFNATPHNIALWGEGCDEPIIVTPDTKIDARAVETTVRRASNFTLVKTEFVGTDEGRSTIVAAKAAGADIILGSIIAAQAYPGEVFAMISCDGYERVAPQEKRMRFDKFTTF